MSEPTTNWIRDQWKLRSDMDADMICRLCDRLDARDKRIAELEETCKDLATQVVRFKGECDAAHRERTHPASDQEATQ